LVGGIVIFILIFFVVGGGYLDNYSKLYQQSFMFGALLFNIGLILPDSDSNNRGSRIFFTVLFPIAYLMRLFEFFLSSVTGRRKGHRNTLHSMVGITFTSFMLVFLFSLIFIYYGFFNIITASWAFVGFWFGQFTHLVCDSHIRFI
jgi:hypothetical protein